MYGGTGLATVALVSTHCALVSTHCALVSTYCARVHCATTPTSWGLNNTITTMANIPQHSPRIDPHHMISPIVGTGIKNINKLSKRDEKSLLYRLLAGAPGVARDQWDQTPLRGPEGPRGPQGSYGVLKNLGALWPLRRVHAASPEVRVHAASSEVRVHAASSEVRVHAASPEVRVHAASPEVRVHPTSLGVSV